VIRAIGIARGFRVPAVRVKADCANILHRRKSEKRGMAQTNCCGRRVVCVASQLISQPLLVQLGVLAHEYGHVLNDTASQAQADRTARKVFGHKIRYVGPLRLQSW